MIKSGLLLLALILASFSVRAREYPVSDHYDGKTFFNPGGNHLLSFWQVLKWKLKGDGTTWPEHVPNQTYSLPKFTSSHRAVVTFINHATFLLQLDDLNILTDPIFSNRAGPSQFLGPARVREPGLRLEELPKIDVVLISHNHYDHLDLPSLKQLDARFHPLFLVPLGDEVLLLEEGIQNVHAMDWWQEHKIKQHKIVFTPSLHWSARGLFDKCKSLWGSFFIHSPDFKIYFAGDTGYSAHFSQIRQRVGTPDVALLPIGAYAPEELMRKSHINPEEAIKAREELGAELGIGMHFGTFPLTDEGMNDPIDRIKKATPEKFIVLDQGESKIF